MVASLDERSGTGAWARLRDHHDEIGDVPLRRLLAHDPERLERMNVEAAGLLLDYSRQRVSDRTIRLLLELARERGLLEWRERLFAGDEVNDTEGRPALHMALRREVGEPFPPGDRDVMPEVRAARGKMRRLAEAVRSGAWRGATGRRIESVLHIGIGGSDLGVSMASEALAAHHEERLDVRHVSNVDSTQLAAALEGLEPATTLLVLVSKSFTTPEVMINGGSARRWLIGVLGGDPEVLRRHLVAVTANVDRAAELGVPADNVLPMWDWVGGRYSVWSAVGLSLALEGGWGILEGMWRGGRAMDRHFVETPWERNMPVLMALLEVWYRNFHGASTRVVHAYDAALSRFPAYLQQLEMESLGKRVARSGEPVGHDTGPVVWGGLGNDGQHAYFQLLHQGTELVPSDFLVPVHSQRPLPGHEDAVLANALAQVEALAMGRTAEEAHGELAAGDSAEDAERLAPHRATRGNQPSSVLLYDRLTPEVLGALIALHEHKVFVESVVWGINPFDQWGVELGKEIARRLLPALAGNEAPGEAAGSVAPLVRRVQQMRRSSTTG